MTPDIRKERETALYEAALRLIAKGGKPRRHEGAADRGRSRNRQGYRV